MFINSINNDATVRAETAVNCTVLKRWLPMELTALAVSVAFLFSHIKAGTSFYEKPFKIGVPTDLNDKRTKVAEIDMQPGA